MLTTKRLVAQAVVAAAALVLNVAVVQATTTPDQAAAIVVYPKIVVDSSLGIDTLIQISNESGSQLQAHCFYVNANSHCTNNGLPCRTGSECLPFGACLPGWAELDFSISLTPNQPLYWVAGAGRNRACAQSGDCEDLPLRGFGRCSGAPTLLCLSTLDCPAGTGTCVGGGIGNAGTSIPPSPEDPFIGELKCIVTNPDGSPSASNWLAGQATITSLQNGAAPIADAQSYSAIGIRSYRDCDGGSNNGMVCVDNDDCPGGSCQAHLNSDQALILGGPARVCVGGSGDGDSCMDDSTCGGGTCTNNREYESCPATLILDHLFDGAPDPITDDTVVTDLTLVPCSQDFLLGSANVGRSTAQFLVFNEFEQRFSTSRLIDCFDEVLLSNIDTRNNTRSIFSINVSGTIAGQSRIRGVGAGLLGSARVQRSSFPPSNVTLPVQGLGAGYNLHEEGQRNSADEEDFIVIP